MKNNVMSPLDSAWLLMESADTPMHVGALAIFRKPRNAPDHYLADVARALRSHRDMQAPWNLRLKGGNGLSRRLERIDDVDLDYHFRHTALPAPGGERELGVLISRLHSNALDRKRPLWEFHLVEGLENKRFAFYLKVHHAVMDEVNLVPMLSALLSVNPRQRNMAPPWSRADEDNPEFEDAVTRLQDGLSRAGESVASLGKAAGVLFRSREKDGSVLLPNGAPRSTLNRAINTQRRVATQQYPLARIERLAAATDSTVNEILTYLAGTSLRRFFKEYNALPDESLVAAAPVSLRETGAQHAGKAMAAIRVGLCTHIGDPLDRLQAIKASIQAVREDLLALPDAAVTPYALLRSAPIIASQLPTLGRMVPPLYNLSISMTAASEKPLYFNGARLEALYPLAQLMQYSALSINCVSYAGSLNFGLTGARDTLPHLQRLALYIGKALTDLEEIVAEERASA
jgi:WS/DGAT/MGAT family acyltransferase